MVTITHKNGYSDARSKTPPGMGTFLFDYILVDNILKKAINSLND